MRIHLALQPMQPALAVGLAQLLILVHLGFPYFVPVNPFQQERDKNYADAGEDTGPGKIAPVDGIMKKGDFPVRPEKKCQEKHRQLNKDNDHQEQPKPYAFLSLKQLLQLYANGAAQGKPDRKNEGRGDGGKKKNMGIGEIAGTQNKQIDNDGKW